MNFTFFDRAAGCFPDVCFDTPPQLALILGSGWSGAVSTDKVLVRIKYSDIEGFGDSSIQGHAGEFMLFERHGKRVAAFCGRHHRYEGAGWEPVVLPVEMARRMSCPNLLATNASGGISPTLKPGDFVVIRDHINTTGENPLTGPHRPEWGARFPDMSEIYTQHLRDLLHAVAKRRGIRVTDGIYACTAGPVYETPAEIRALRAMGADIVGMSTVHETTFARACGIKAAGLSLVSNLAAGISAQRLSHEEVIAAGEAARPLMSRIIDDFIREI